jgi:hypothetical protein
MKIEPVQYKLLCILTALPILNIHQIHLNFSVEVYAYLTYALRHFPQALLCLSLYWDHSSMYQVHIYY